MPNPRWKIKPAGSTWGDFGPDDQLGRLNLVTPEKVKQGVAEVREGLSFCLSMPLDYPGGTIVNPRRHPPRLFANQRLGRGFESTRVGGTKDIKHRLGNHRSRFRRSVPFHRRWPHLDCRANCVG